MFQPKDVREVNVCFHYWFYCIPSEPDWSPTSLAFCSRMSPRHTSLGAVVRWGTGFRSETTVQDHQVFSVGLTVERAWRHETTGPSPPEVSHGQHTGSACDLSPRPLCICSSHIFFTSLLSSSPPCHVSVFLFVLLICSGRFLHSLVHHLTLFQLFIFFLLVNSSSSLSAYSPCCSPFPAVTPPLV